MRAGVALALAALCLVTQAAAAGDGQPLRGTVPRVMVRLPDAGPVPGDLELDHVLVFLGLRERAALEAFIAARQDPRSPRFRERLEPAEIADRFGARRADYERVRGWFTRQGLEVARDSPFRVAFVLRGRAAAFERALATRLRWVRHRGRAHHVPASDPVVPAEIAASVRGLVGLDDLPAYRPLHLVPDTQTLGLSPNDFATVYGAQGLRAAFTGAGRSIAVVARSNFDDSDIAGFSSLFGLALSPVRKLAGRDPGVLPDEGEETEVLLDTQWAGALAPGAQINVVIGSRRGNIPEALEKAVNDREGDLITISFGLCEPFTSTLAAELFDAFYTIANAQGQTVLVASGDGGATECEDGTDTVAVNALASSPHAIAVGGTSFGLAADGSLPDPLGERVWADAFGAGGGGQSALFARPRHQFAAGMPAAFDGRLLPDLAVAASPDTPGYIIFQDGLPQVIGGTSAGAPALASVLALVNERLAAAAPGFDGLGHVLPNVYRLAVEGARGLRPPVFRDVVDGTNALPDSIGFPATAGFDLATGWGAPILDALADGLGEPARCEPEIAPVGGCVVPATGPKKKACAVSWLLERPNLLLKRDVPSRRQHCRDGDPVCDEDGAVDGRCTVSVALCLNVFDFRSSRLSPRRLPRCEPGVVRTLELLGGGRFTSLAADDDARLRAALGALPTLPTGLRAACTASVPIAVPVAGPEASGRVNLRARTRGSLGTTTARVALLCDP